MDFEDVIYSISPFIGFGLFVLAFMQLQKHVDRKERKKRERSNELMDTQQRTVDRVNLQISQRRRELALQSMYAVHGKKFVESLNDKDYFEMVDQVAKEMTEIHGFKSNQILQEGIDSRKGSKHTKN